MKIYVEESNNTILKKIASNTKMMNKIEKYLDSKKIIKKIYSRQGFYEIDCNKTYNLKIISDNVDKQKVMFEKNEYVLVTDKSKIEKNIVFQIPYEHVCVSLLVSRYVNKSNQNLKFVVETLYDSDTNLEVRPINYYFEYSSVENNAIPIEDINVFLSMLN